MKSIFLVLALFIVVAPLPGLDAMFIGNEELKKVEAIKIDCRNDGDMGGYLAVDDWVDITKEYSDLVTILSNPEMYDDQFAMCHMPGFVLKVTTDKEIKQYTVCLACHNVYLIKNGKRSGDGFSFSKTGNRFLKALYFDAFMMKTEINAAFGKDE